MLCIAFLTISVLLFLCVACGQRMENLLDQGYYRDSSGAMIFVDLDQIYNDNCTLSIDRAKVSSTICLLVGTKVCILCSVCLFEHEMYSVRVM